MQGNNIDFFIYYNVIRGKYYKSQVIFTTEPKGKTHETKREERKDREEIQREFRKDGEEAQREKENNS